MKWAMSDDYAALITTVILAVLLIGTVQTYTLLRAWVNSQVEAVRRGVDAHNRVAAAVKDGREPNDEDLQEVVKLRRPHHVVLQAWPAVLAGAVWLGVCATLVGMQIRVLQWAGTHEPATNPALAEKAFYVCSAAIVLLVAEGLVRTLARGISGIRQATQSYEALDPQERAGTLTAIAEYARRRAQ